MLCILSCNPCYVHDPPKPKITKCVDVVFGTEKIVFIFEHLSNKHVYESFSYNRDEEAKLQQKVPLKE